MLTEAEIQFILENEGADTSRLLLGTLKKGKRSVPAGQSAINVPLCVKCIQAREKMKHKAPLWYKCPSLAYPFSVSVEQGSSQSTALFKQHIISHIKSAGTSAGFITADLTGGMGIDTFFISAIADKHYYFERNTQLFQATEYNLGELGADNIIFNNCDITENDCAAVRQLKGKGISLIYIDPARRTQTGGKAIMLQDYEPNIVELQDLLFEASRYILVKVSPMADIKQNLQLLEKTSRVYIVAVNNECKELLFLLDSQHNGEEPCIHSCNIENTDPQNISGHNNVSFKMSEEEQAQAQYTSNVEKYLYEPGKAVIKSGAYKLLSQKYCCNKLAPSTHLYTSDELKEDFPGKTFVVEEVVPFNKKALKEVASRHPHADITARNFPIDTNALKKLSGIKDGGSRHIFAVTLTNGEKVLIITLPAKLLHQNH